MKISNPLISILVPVYNAEDFLVKCLDSIVNQDYTNLEIILINDGSTDNSGQILRDYASNDKRIKLLEKENGGIGSAYKLALLHVTGDYVSFVDSDDYLEPKAYTSLVQIMEDYSPDFIHYGIRVVDLNANEIKLYDAIDKVVADRAEVLQLHFNQLRHPSLARIFKKSLFDNVVIFEQNIGIDEMLTPQLLAKVDNAVYTSEIFYNVVARPTSISRSVYTIKKITETIRVYEFILQFVHKTIPEFDRVIRRKYLPILLSIYTNIIINIRDKDVRNMVFQKLVEQRSFFELEDKEYFESTGLAKSLKWVMNFPLLARMKGWLMKSKVFGTS